MVTVTTSEAIKILKARGIAVNYPTLAVWVRSGKFKGAALRDEARGPVWHIPLRSVERFVPPDRGRPRKPTNGK
jgi:hypothetical protein